MQLQAQKSFIWLKIIAGDSGPFKMLVSLSQIAYLYLNSPVGIASGQARLHGASCDHLYILS